MEIWSEIRRAVPTGASSKRAAIAKYKVGWHTLKKMLANDEPPGEAQVDFGEATVRIAGKETKVALFVMTLPYSGAMFVQVQKYGDSAVSVAAILAGQPHDPLHEMGLVIRHTTRPTLCVP